MGRCVRTAFLLSILLLLPLYLFAGGSSEAMEVTTTLPSGEEVTISSVEELMETSPTTNAGFLYSIANVYDEITSAFCLGLTPFPNTLVQFYGGVGTADYNVNENMGNLSLNNALLVGDGYYTAEGGNLSFGNKVYQGKGSEAQRSIWNMITVLFISFMLAEIVFTAIYHYIADKEGSVIKEIIAKVVMAMAIFLIASALPFIIELFRVGFVSAASILTDVDAQITESTDDIEEADASSGGGTLDSSSSSVISSKVLQLLKEMRVYPVFFYPGTLIRSVSEVFGYMDPDNVAGSGISIQDATSKEAGFIVGGIINGLMDIVYLIIKMVSSIMVLIAALHIMYNVCEVYLLLGCVMLLLPFTIFSPLKFLGEKAVMSLFANVLELFVIVMIMFSTISIASTVTSGLLSALLSDVKWGTVEISFSNLDGLLKELNHEIYKDQLSNLVDEDGVFRLTAFLVGPDDSGYVVMFDQALSGTEYSGNASLAAVIDSISIEWIPEHWDAAVETLITNDPDNVLNEITKTLKFAYDSKGFPADKYKEFVKSEGFTQLPVQDKYAALNYLAGTAGKNMGMSVSNTPEYERGLDPALGPMDLYFMHIVSFLLIILMQTYFINQSSQITNALLSGNVSSEGFTGALTRIAGAKALGAAGKAAAMPGKALGGLGRFGLGVYGQKHADTKRGALATFAAGDNMEKLAKAFTDRGNTSTSQSNQGDGGKKI